MTLSDQDSGRNVSVHAGEIVTVRLPENPTTGFKWTVESAGSLQQTGNRYEPGGGSGAPGAAGIRVMEFHAASEGESELRMKHWCEWEGEGSVTNRFAARITVTQRS